MNSNKTIVLICAIFFFVVNAHAQSSNLVVFTQANEPFTVIMNGIQQSPNPETNVKVTELTAPSYKVKIIFQNQNIPEIDKTVYLQREVEATYEILRNNKGVWVLRMLNSTPLDEVSDRLPGQEVYIYTNVPRVSTTSVSQSTTVTTGGVFGGASITTTTTQTTSNTGSQHPYEDRQQEGFENSDHSGHFDHDDYSGPKGCQRPMNPSAFDKAVESISSKSFETSKLTIAKQIVESNCLLCKQVKEIMKLFTYESNRLEFAKFAYKYTWDINNYFMLNDAFEFESSISDLNKYIKGRK